MNEPRPEPKHDDQPVPKKEQERKPEELPVLPEQPSPMDIVPPAFFPDMGWF